MSRTVRFAVWTVLAALCLIYGIIVASVNSGTGFFVVWIILAGVFALAAAACRFRVWDRIPGKWKIIFRIVFFALLAFFIVLECLIGSRFHERGKSNLDYIIVLGSQVYRDGPSAVLKYRLDKAVEYLNENPETVCIVSGGQGSNEPFPEAVGMADYLEKSGIPPERILREAESLTTAQNIGNCRKLIGPGAEVGIVTNNFHMFRALQIAESAGLENACGICADSTPLFLPNNMLREFFAETLFLIRRA